MKKITKIVAVLSAFGALVGCSSSGGNPYKDITVDYDFSAKTSFKVGISQLVDHVALNAASEGFMEELKTKVEAAGKTVEFDYQKCSADTSICATVANKFVTSSYDLVLGNATAALQACVSATKTIPVLGTSITDYASALGITNWDGTVYGNITGTSDLAPLAKQAGMVKTMFPDAKTVGIIYCNAEANSKYQATEMQKELKALGLTVKLYKFSDSNDLSGVATKACTNSDVAYVPTDNTCASNTELLYAASKNAKTPIIAGEEGICKGCGVATLSISYSDLGKKTGDMAAEILLNNKKTDTMPIEYAESTTYEYNKTICDELGITAPADWVAIAE